MTYFEWMELLRAMLPNLIGLLFITGMLGSAFLAVHTSPDEPAADRHFVLLLSLGGVGAVFGFAIFMRAIFGIGWTGDSVTPDRLLAGLGVAWTLGLVVLLVRLVVGWLAVACLRRARSSAGPGADLKPLMRQCARDVGLRSVPKVIFARRCASPMTTGIVDPVVFLPTSLQTADVAELRLVLTHEFAHVRRKDCLAELMVQLIGALLWWNPLYWVVAKKVRVLREMVCDQIVAFECQSRDRYAELLIRFAVRTMLPFGPGFAVIRMSDKSSLHARIEHLVHGTRIRDTWFPRILPSAMSNAETIGFVLFAVFVLVSFDAMFVASFQEVCVSLELAP